MKTFSCTAVALVALLAVGCSSTDDKTPSTSSSSSSGTSGTSSSGTSGTPAGSDSTSSGSTSSTSGAPAATLKAPTLDMVEKMSGALHVMWTNNEPACDAIVLERQAQMSDGSIMEKYKVIATLPGEADNKHDTTATDNMKYTYRLRCKKGTAYSEYSNEMSGNPKQ